MLLNQILRHAAQWPHQVAVQDREQRLTYAELGIESARIATLLQGASIERGALVALYQERGVIMIASIVGVWMSGGAYTVVEANGSPEEHYHRLSTIGPDVVLTTGEYAADLTARGFRVCVIDTRQAWEGTAPMCANARTLDAGRAMVATDLAYVLFTSGSTGVPKGVMVTHGNIVHYVDALIARLDIPPGLRYAHVSTMSADLGNTSLFLSLWTGGTLHVLDDGYRRDPTALLDYLARHEVDVLKITPSHWEAVFALIRASGVRGLDLQYLVLGGETLSGKLAGEVLDAGVARHLVNHYGPTETTVGITVYPVLRDARAALTASETVPIGLPLGDTRLIVRTADGAFHSVDAQGELYVGGPSVSAGYRQNPDANARSFVTGIEGNTRFYRTGDIVRIDERGVAHFMGRADRQVKINGYRIELEQIERALKTLDGCEGAAAFVVDIRGRPAVAAAVCARASRTPAELREQLARILPAYMIPRTLLWLPAFPLTPNGKADLARVRALIEASLITPQASADERAEEGDTILTEVRLAWRHCLGHDSFGDTDDFFELGGDSLDAIGVIASLQAAGHRISARRFLKEPTIEALALHLRAASGASAPESHRSAARAPVGIERFSPAQRIFFEQRLTRPDHHNQALMFDLDDAPSADLLQQAFECLRTWHPLLTTRYRRLDATWTAEPLAPDELGPVLQVTELPTELDRDATAVLVRRTSQALQASLSLERGRLFVAHLFRRASGTSHLLICAHHVVVDVVSWRILIDDLTRVYGALVDTAVPPPRPASRAIHDWAGHVASTDALHADLALWRKLPANVMRARIGAPLKGNLERHAKSVWLSFSRDATSALLRKLPEALAAPFHHILLAACVQAFDEAGNSSGQDCLVELESHGRISFDDDVDVSRTAGWFTSAYPVALSSVRGDLAGTVKRVDATLAAVPNLGVAYGVHRDGLKREWGGVPVPRLCYNYLGQFEFNGDGALRLRPSTLSPGFARGYDNDRIHEFKFTARVLDGQLICDLGYSSERHDQPAIRAIVDRTAALLLGLLRKDNRGQSKLANGLVRGEHARLERDFNVYVEAGSSTGLLTYRPAGLSIGENCTVDRPGRRRYQHVLLTGATGFVGAYVLSELLRETEAEIHCLVRAATDAEAARRLAAAYDWYFPETPLSTNGARVHAYAGDVSREYLGMERNVYDQLDIGVDAIYHFAADTRLFAADDVLEQHNIAGTRRLISMASGLRGKDLHHMSTLAVCGVNRSGESLVFSEATLDIGQDFLNAYEQTKFKAEQMVSEFVSRGGRAFIYRSGNVSADSRNGRFQRNAADNRFVQVLRAAVKIGSLPADVGEPVALSPVDVVARGIVALSVRTMQASGVYHVDSSWECSMDDVFDELRGLGIHFESTSHATFADLFGSGVAASDRDVALGYFWASRPQRHVKFDRSRTLRALKGIGCEFAPPKRAWLREFLVSLIDAGVLTRQPSLLA